MREAESESKAATIILTVLARWALHVLLLQE